MRELPTYSIDYFNARVVVDANGCWNWKLSRNRYGYGKRGPLFLAHRVAYHSLVGPIPEGLVLDHLCRNRACINPDHLEPVTSLENVKRGNYWPDQQRAATHCKHGHPYDEDNTYWRPTGQRDCRACGRERTRRYKTRLANAA